MRFFGFFLSFVGLALLLVAVIGHWTSFGDYQSAPPRQWEEFDPNLAAVTNSILKLDETAKSQLSADSSESEIMAAMYDIVTKRFTHRSADHTFFSNWLLYLAGKVHPTLSYIRDPDLMVQKGHSLLCGQSSYLLLHLALKNDIRARHVGLDGHVVMEAWYDSDWHLYDPDLEVVPVDPTGQILSVEELALDRELLEKYYGLHDMVQIVGSRENNTYMSYPEGSRFEWKSNVLVYIEIVMEVLKFLIPMALIVLGYSLTKRSTSSST